MKKLLILLVFVPVGAVVPCARGDDARMVELGRMLFFENRLSGDDGFSCAKCHDPEKAFTDGLALSKGYPGTMYFRNAKTVMNVREMEFVYWDGRLSGKDLPTLVRDHIAESHFMNADGRLVSERLRQVPYYERTFREVFGTEPRYGGILKAVAAFLRTLNSENVPFDRFLDGDRSAISQTAKDGYELFRGKAGCANCHSGRLLTDGEFHNTGVPMNDEIFTEPMRHIVFRRFFKTIGVAGYGDLAKDVGRYAVTKNAADRGAFLTPSLREVGRTAPYMHNGMLKTLGDVVDFYNQGGGEGPPALRRSVLRALGLTTHEKKALVEFLETLSGDKLVVEAPKRLEYELRPLPTFHQPPSAGAPPIEDEEGDIGKIVDFQSVPPIGALPEPPIPPDNLITDEKVELGKFLFFDSRLAGDASNSCASCHDPKLGWGDGNDMSRGYPGTKHWRNGNTVINSAYFTKLFWAGSVTSLEKQANSAITGNVAGNGDPMMIEERLAQIPEYVERFKNVFGTERPLYGDVLRAISTFERKMVISRNTPFDRYARGEKTALSESAKRGLDLFQGKARCILCHNGANFTDEDYHNLGVGENEAFAEDVQRQITLRFEYFAKGVSERYYHEARWDLRLFYRTKHPRDMCKFRTPHLRELKWTVPFMHNGVFYTLEEVVDFYDQGGGKSPGRKDPLVKPLNLTKTEKKDLIKFLESLSSKRKPLQIKPPVLPEYAVMIPKGLNK
jgi:cytochrome c peroxidase